MIDDDATAYVYIRGDLKSSRYWVDVSARSPSNLPGAIGCNCYTRPCASFIEALLCAFAESDGHCAVHYFLGAKP
jgi:hypothetical protein